jgi:hypothetical protein
VVEANRSEVPDRLLGQDRPILKVVVASFHALSKDGLRARSILYERCCLRIVSATVPIRLSMRLAYSI